MTGDETERLRDPPPDDVDATVSVESGEAADASARILERLRSGDASYRTEGEIGRGGMGAVLKVWDARLRRRLAMKVVLERGRGSEHATAEEANPALLARFLEEAQVTGQLDHPGIVPVHELGLDETGRVYFTMRLVKGRDLKRIFQLVRSGEEDWSVTRALGVLLKVCEAMAYAHAKGVIHRDLKPANVMVGQFGEAYVMDWGLARVLGAEDRRDVRPDFDTSQALSKVETEQRDGSTADDALCTMDGHILGTPSYMSPEQARGEVGKLDARTDVYAMGAILYHLLAGEMPFVPSGTRVPAQLVLMRALDGPPKPLAELAPDAPPELVAICEKAMARDARDRYPNMSALAEDLRAFLEHRVVHAYRTGAWVEARKWVSRNKALAASLAAGVLVLVGGLAASLVLKAQADRNALAEKRRADEVFRLSALQKCDDLIAEAGRLWPIHGNLDAYADWVDRAQLLVDDLPVHVAKRDELRAEALPRTEDERRRDRESHPGFAELTRLRAEVDAGEAALLQRRDGVAVELPDVDWSAAPADANGLNEIAWPLVDPERESFGGEARGLAVALRARELAKEAGDDVLFALIGDTVSRAFFAVGRDEEALAASREAMDAAPDERKEEFAAYLRDLESWIAEAQSDDGIRAAEEGLSARRAELQALDASVDERRTWRFPPERGESPWWNNQLTKLIELLSWFREPATGLLSPAGVSPEHGWSIPRRLELARRLRDGFAPGGDFAARWDRDLPAIRAAYPGLALSPQVGLVPIGADPDSKLWEFWHVASGEEPVRGADGRLAPTERTGIVFVLLPGGTFRMGAQATDPADPNYDVAARNAEGPVLEVTLKPFFLSKYELTQGQWEGFAGWNRSTYGSSGWATSWSVTGEDGSLLAPVTDVSWDDCRTWLDRLGLSFPTEAQWEYAARAGTDTPWWTGAEPASLQGAANIADSYAREHGAVSTWTIDEEIDDGFTIHAPVGRYAANPFGLHDVHGNVWEWCLDGYDPEYHLSASAAEPVSPWEEATSHSYRGGAFFRPAMSARASERYDYPASSANHGLGLRPARAVR